MKNAYILFISLLVLASCSPWKYNKGIKGKKTEFHASRPKAAEPQEDRTTAAVEKDELQPETREVPAPSQPEAEIETAQKTEISETVDSEEETIILSREDDSTEVVTPEMVRMAFEAEDEGRKSRNLGIAGLVMSLTYILTLIGLVFCVVALIKGIKSLKSRYNTPKGVKMARTGVIISSIILGLYVLAIFFLIALIFVLLL